MLDRYELWHTAAGILLMLLARQHPRVRELWGPRGGVWVAAGLVLPVASYVVALADSPDSLAFLTRQRWLHSLSTGLLTVGGLGFLAALALGRRAGLRAAVLVLAGFLLHLILEGLTPAGIWLGPVSHSVRRAWPAFAEGHLLLVTVLAAGLAALRLRPGTRRRLIPGTWSIVALYAVGGLIQYGVVRARATPPGAGPVEVVPAGHWRYSWLAIAQEQEEIRVTLLGPWGAVTDRSERLAAWNDQMLLLEMIGDPVVRHFYFGVFRHPVATIDSGPSDVTLTLREAGSAALGEESPRFTLNWSDGGQERTYAVEGFR